MIRRSAGLRSLLSAAARRIEGLTAAKAAASAS
jgi:hypothetical protein